MFSLILIRGIPGSGKTTGALDVCKELDIKHHFEADMYFTDHNNNYCFEKDRIKEANEWCKTQTENKLQNKESVVVSNTFIKLWEIEEYISLATKYNARLIVVECKKVFKNIHNVPEEVIERMTNNWEPYPGAIQYGY